MCIESSVNETAGKPHIHLIHCGQLSVSDNNFIMLQQNIRLSGATVVVTGAAGFIGASLTRRLLDEYPDCRVCQRGERGAFQDRAMPSQRPMCHR